MIRIYFLAALLAALWPLPVFAEEDPEAEALTHAVRGYRNREERRDAGIKHELTEWLTVSGLLEIEQQWTRFDLAENEGRTEEEDFAKSLQFDIEIKPWQDTKIELVYEYDDDSHRAIFDEVIFAVEIGDFELELGRLYVPFGQYNSFFASGPLLEFGETQDDALVLSYSPIDELELAIFAFDGEVQKMAGGHTLDWGFSVEGSFALGSFGLSYLSDLAEAEEDFLLDEGQRYERRVDAWSAYALVGVGSFELAAEYLSALADFQALEADRNRPQAWNIELAYFPGSFEWALRLAGSEELEDAPHLQGGLSVSGRLMKNTRFTLEYLQGSFRSGLAEDAAEREVERSWQVGGQLSLEF